MKKINKYKKRKCKYCGCTDNFACLGGCWWIEGDICSECDEKDED